MKYLYSFADGGDFCQSDRGPGPDELDSIADGELTVVRFQDGTFQWAEPDGTWKAIPTFVEPTHPEAS